MKKEARLLHDRAIDALTLSIDHFNRAWDVARAEGVLIQLDRSFEMLLKGKYSRFPTPSGDGSPCGPGALALGTTSGQEVRSA